MDNNNFETSRPVSLQETQNPKIETQNNTFTRVADVITKTPDSFDRNEASRKLLGLVTPKHPHSPLTQNQKIAAGWFALNENEKGQAVLNKSHQPEQKSS
jgi:hypothetical protein